MTESFIRRESVQNMFLFSSYSFQEVKFNEHMIIFVFIVLHSKKKEGTSTIHDSMGRAGELSEISQAVKDKYNMISSISGT